jgi:hypothetical protein
MANENWRSLVGFTHDATGPARSPAWTSRRMNGSGVNLSREKLSEIQKRDPHRAASQSRILLSSYEIEWDFPVTSATEYLSLVFGAMADVGRAEVSGGDTVYKIGRGKDPVRTDIFLTGADGSHYIGRRALLTNLVLNVDLIQQCRMQATFAPRELAVTETDTFAGSAAPVSGRPATALDATVTIEDTAARVFGWSVAFQREAKAGGFSEASVAAAWDGNLTPDIGGKMVCRCPRADFDEAFKTQIIRGITAVVQLPGGAALTMEFPRCILQATSKRVLSTEGYEYALEWAALQADDGDAATVTLES